jgi:hypothetical protein
LVKDDMTTSRHCDHFGNSGLRFRQCQLRKGANAGKNLPSAEAAFFGEALPVSPHSWAENPDQTL